jgi:hypothetical protein
MNASDYQIKRAGRQFKVVDPWGEQLVHLFPTKEAAQKDIERCKREDALYETATQLIEISEEVLMQKFGVDRKTAQHWVSSAMGG